MLDLHMGDTVRLKKKHPCGGFQWEVVRLGADIGLVCMTCRHRILLDRLVVERRVREVIHGEEGHAAPTP
jgi:hypothetical protein